MKSPSCLVLVLLRLARLAAATCHTRIRGFHAVHDLVEVHVDLVDVFARIVELLDDLRSPRGNVLCRGRIVLLLLLLLWRRRLLLLLLLLLLLRRRLLSRRLLRLIIVEKLDDASHLVGTLVVPAAAAIAGLQLPQDAVAGALLGAIITPLGRVALLRGRRCRLARHPAAQDSAHVAHQDAQALATQRDAAGDRVVVAPVLAAAERGALLGVGSARRRRAEDARSLRLQTVDDTLMVHHGLQRGKTTSSEDSLAIGQIATAGAGPKVRDEAITTDV